MQKINDPVKDYSKILGNLHYTHYYLMDRYKKILQPYGLTVIQSNILGIIMHRYPESLSLEEVKEMVLEPNSDVSRTVVRLSEKGFIKKVPDKKNRRKVSIIITPKGIKTAKRLESDEHFKKFSEEITLSESKAFIKFLSKLRSK
ncbi:MAG: MarR family winged helix-turn-helix transcriptional regulator [Bacteroidia bacterium]